MAVLRLPIRHILLAFVLHLFYPRKTSSRPMDQSEPTYVPDPKGRGTFSLVFTCVITMFLCVWTALHVNVFPKGTSWLKQTLWKTYWASVALFAPEVVLFTAAVQWVHARRLRDVRNTYLRDQSSRREQAGRIESSDSFTVVDAEYKRKEWSIEHGFFVLMGGFEVTVKDEEKWILNDGQTVTPLGFDALAKRDLLLQVDLETIKARGKTDQLAKALVCIQAAWMVTQTIARKASGLPVTLLEINTLAHVVCAVLMYSIWWRKPQNVNEPVTIHLEPTIAASMSAHRLKRSFKRAYCIDGEPEEPEPGYENVLPRNESGFKVIGRLGTRREGYYLKDIENAFKRNGVVMLLPGQALEGIPFTPEFWPYHLTANDIKRLQFRANDSTPLPYGRCLAKHASNFLADGDLWGHREILGYPIFALLSFLYGAVHATAWHAHFPGRIEQTMWRVAACIVSGGGLTTWGLMTWANYIPYEKRRAFKELLENSLGKILSKVLLRLFRYVRLVILAFLFLCLASSRIFLVVEAFISVRSLPLGAYSTVSWANVLPHIG